MSKNFVRNTAFLTILVVVVAGFFIFPRVQQQSIKTAVTPTLIVSPKENSTTFSYNGKEGIDALSLLREQTPVEQDGSGMVSSINGRKADGAKHEYWAFYVNGKLAPVGAHEFVTKDTDKIEWKIEKY